MLIVGTASNCWKFSFWLQNSVNPFPKVTPIISDGNVPTISVVATANVIARPADFEIGTGASSVGSLSHMLTMMRKYKKAAITAARMMPNLATKPGTQSSKMK